MTPSVREFILPTLREGSEPSVDGVVVFPKIPCPHLEATTTLGVDRARAVIQRNFEEGREVYEKSSCCSLLGYFIG